MRKPFNVRLPVLFAAALCAGIVYSTLLAYFRLNGIYILIPVLVLLAVCFPVAIYKGSASKPLIVVFTALVFLIGAAYMYAEYCSFCNAEVLEGVSVKLTGKVDEVGVSANGNRYLILSGVASDGAKIKGKVVAYLNENSGEYCRRGYLVEFYAELTKQNFIEFGEVSYNACRGVKYVCTVNGGMRAAYRFNLFGEINNAFENALYSNLDKETAAVCFAMLTGNTDGISAGTLSSFRNGGVAHVFAVSGLHIGVIYGALTFIFKKSGVNRFVSTAVRIAFIALYSGVCLFSPSSVRALIMCSVSAVAGCFRRKYDSLNALALAAVILLLINPMYIFGVGFILSFSAVLGIIFLSKNLNRLFGFLPAKISRALSAGWSAQFAVLPAQLVSFGYISAAGLVLNLVFIPLISALYVMLFICATLSVIMPFAANVLLQSSAVPVQFVINVITSCGFENSLVSGNFGRLVYLPFTLLILGLTDKVNLGCLPRTALVCACLLSLLFMTAASVRNDRYTAVEFASGYSGGAVTLDTAEGTVLVVTSNFRGGNGFDAQADVLVVLGYDDEFSEITSLGADYGEIYVRGSAFPVPSLGDTPVNCSDSFTVFGIDFAFGANMLTAEVCGTQIALVYDRGGNYSAGSSGCPFEIYCYGNDGALLKADGGGYALDFCGAMKFEIAAAGFEPSHLIPQEC